MSIEDHRWANNYLTTTGGVIHALRVRAYYKEVIQPALITLDAQIEVWKGNPDGGAPFAEDDARQRDGDGQRARRPWSVLQAKVSS